MDKFDNQHELENEKTLRDKVFAAVSRDIARYVSNSPSPLDGFKAISKAVGRDVRTIKRWLNQEGTTAKNIMKLYCFLTEAQSIKELEKHTPTEVFNYFSKNQCIDEIKDSLVIKSRDFNSDTFSRIFNASKTNADIFAYLLIDEGVSHFDLQIKFGEYGNNLVQKYIACGAIEKNDDQKYCLSKSFNTAYTAFPVDFSSYINKTFEVEDFETPNRVLAAASIRGVSKKGLHLMMLKAQEFRIEMEKIANDHEGSEVMSGFSITISDIFDSMNSAPLSKKDLLQ